MKINMRKFNQISQRVVMPEQKVAAYNKRLAELIRFKDTTTEELGKKCEIVMLREHICNTNLKLDEDQKLMWKHPSSKKEFRIKNF